MTFRFKCITFVMNMNSVNSSPPKTGFKISNAVHAKFSPFLCGPVLCILIIVISNKCCGPQNDVDGWRTIQYKIGCRLGNHVLHYIVFLPKSCADLKTFLEQMARKIVHIHLGESSSCFTFTRSIFF